MLHSFAGVDAANPATGLIQGPDGTLYGTTQDGGGSCGFFACGTVFKLAPDGSGFIVLHSFTGSDGVNPSALIQAPDGTLYGTTAFGGIGEPFGFGVVFQLTLSPNAPTSTRVGHK